MEDILASIRRILNDQQPPALPDTPEAPEKRKTDDVLMLDRSMIVPGETPPPDDASSPPPERASSSAAPAGPEATAVGERLGVAAERTLQVHATGPTIEDIVRAEMRPLLQTWLDAHLPDLVERLIRAEIERVVRRAVP